MIPIRRLNHAVLYVRDAAKAAAFYRQAFGFETVVEMPGAAFLPIRNGGAGVLQYTATSTAPYLQITPAQAVNNATIRVLADAKNLQPGIYNDDVG